MTFVTSMYLRRNKKEKRYWQWLIFASPADFTCLSFLFVSIFLFLHLFLCGHFLIQECSDPTPLSVCYRCGGPFHFVSLTARQFLLELFLLCEWPWKIDQYPVASVLMLSLCRLISYQFSPVVLRCSFVDNLSPHFLCSQIVCVLFCSVLSSIFQFFSGLCLCR